MGQYDSLRRRKDRRDSSGLSPEEERYGTISAIPRNPVMGAVSDAAGGVRSFMNKAQIPAAIPLVGGQGVGELLVGQAPEELDRWAYGDSPFVDKNVPGYSGLRGIPDIQTKRTGPLADTLFFGADAAGVGMGVRALGRAGGRKAAQSFDNAVNTGQDPSRREFIKNAGIVGAGTAVAAATPPLLKGLTRTVAKAAPNPTTVATRVAKNSVGSVSEFYKTMRGMLAHRGKLARKYNTELQEAPLHKKAIDDRYAAMKKRQEEFPYAAEHEPDWEYHDMDEALWSYQADLQAEAAERASLEYEDALVDLLDANPDYYNLPPPDVLRTMRREEFTPELLERLGMEVDSDKIEALVRGGGKYTDPTTGNSAIVDKFGNFAWQSPDGSIRAHQHWLPEYVPDKDIGRWPPDSYLRPATDTEDIPF